MDTLASTSAGTSTIGEFELKSAEPKFLPESMSGSAGKSTDVESVVTSRSGDTRVAGRTRVIRVAQKPVARKARSARGFISLARWEGSVLERCATYFVAELIDLENGERATAEFQLENVKPGDLALCEPGALFYWSVGYEVRENGQRVRASELRFRRVGTAANRV
ncbi:hypothetical protein GCM10027073_55770 [Streptomyces chlorus]|uniref:Uncharacterized protein n=1 Tax=Streptomyces chlorus TaxID=887452 RepID=A0ABW1E4L3_9ACTN